MDYGREILFWHGFPAAGPSEIEPGRFVIRSGPGFQMSVVKEGPTPYAGIALDRPLPGPDRIMLALHLQPVDDDPPRPSWLRNWWETDGRRPRIGHDLADRAWDLSSTLEHLLRRFGANPRRSSTGFIAESPQARALVAAVGPMERGR